MSEKEKQIIKKLSGTIPKLDKEKQNYILGVAEGMAIAREVEDEKIDAGSIGKDKSQMAAGQGE